MARIIINGITHEEACTYGADEGADQQYAEQFPIWFARLEAAAKEAGHTVEIDEQGQGSSSYRVIENDYEDYESANEFMQYSAPEFWN